MNPPAFLDWSRLRNPVLSDPDWSLKDACVHYHAGLFHLFTSAFNEERSTVIGITTPDFQTYTKTGLCLTGPELEAVGICSPNITVAGDRFLLTLNTWGQRPPRLNQLYYLESPDLRHWSAPRPLAGNLTAGHRCIDLALAGAPGQWIGIWKEGSRTRIATAAQLDGDWQFLGTGDLLFERAMPSRDPKIIHENFQFLMLDGVWHLLSTDYPPHHPWLYRRAGDDWTHWVDGRRLLIPSERFNSIPAALAAPKLTPCWDNPAAGHIVDGLDNAAFLCDWRDSDGHFYLLYAGKNEDGRDRFNGTASDGPWPRGWNKLALARSRDLQTWTVAGLA